MLRIVKNIIRLLLVAFVFVFVPYKVRATSHLYLITYQIKFIQPGVKEVFLPFPLDLPEQHVLGWSLYPKHLKASLFYESHFGNPVLHLKTAARQIKVNYLVKREEFIPQLEDYNGFQKIYPFKQYFTITPTPQIKKMAYKIVQGITDPLIKVKRIYQFVIDFMRYNKKCPTAGKGDLRAILKFKQGNCVDYHSLFMALCNAVGLPTMFEIGIVLPSTKSGEINGYHSWVKVIIPGRGIWPVDVSEADKHPQLRNYYFGHLPANRITLSRGRFIKICPKCQPLNFFINPLIFSPNPASFKIKMSFKTFY